MQIVFVLVDDPPQRIAGDVVHHPRQRRVVPHEVEAGRNQRHIVEYRQNAADFRVEIPHPDQPVAFGAVVDVILHIQQQRVGAGFPDPVQPLVGAAEGAAALQVAVQRDRKHVHQFELRVERIDPHEAERGVTVFEHPHRRNLQFGVVNRVILIRRSHRLARRLSEPKPDAPRAGAVHDPHPAVQFNAEVEQQRAAGLQNADPLRA